MKINLNIIVNPDPVNWKVLTQRPSIDAASISGTIDSIFEAVESRGDEALRDYTERFDKVILKDLLVSAEEIEAAVSSVPKRLKEAIELAYQNIHAFHEAQIEVKKQVETSPGVTCWRESRPIERVGIYIPGGSAPLFSTVLMLAIPARIAGCQEIVLCTPPGREGKIHPAILFAANLCGITMVARIGGAQAIAALTLGTESVPAVYKIFGPGNQYVTAAKLKTIEYGVAIDLPAGPSEVLVYADETCHPSFVAADLLSQAEHGPDSQVVLVATRKDLAEAVKKELESQLNSLPRRDIAQQALQHAFVCTFEKAETAFSFINEYAPEHFIIASDRAASYISWIQNAGSVFLGNMTPESAGDYASGTNHTLPTASYAKAFSGVSLDSFIKKITFQHISAQGLSHIGPAIAEMAREEELDAHARAVEIRMSTG